MSDTLGNTIGTKVNALVLIKNVYFDNCGHLIEHYIKNTR